MTHDSTRRTVLVAGATAAFAAGCGSSDDSGSAASPTPSVPGSTPATATDSASASTTAPAGEKLSAKSDIPVGGGKVFAEQKVVVTQPTEGDFKAFSAVCTHQGCTVKQVADGTIDCPCHGSRFRVSDGSVAHGPATRPLPARQITVSGDAITLA